MLKMVIHNVILRFLKDQKSFVKNNGCQFMTVIQYKECQLNQTTHIDTHYVVALIAAYTGFLTLRSREKWREARHRKVYLLILQNEVFIKLAATIHKM